MSIQNWHDCIWQGFPYTFFWLQPKYYIFGCNPNELNFVRGGGGAHLYLKLDIILVKKIHIIRVVFQDQAMYARTSFRGAKTCKIGKKVCFGHID